MVGGGTDLRRDDLHLVVSKYKHGDDAMPVNIFRVEGSQHLTSVTRNQTLLCYSTRPKFELYVTKYLSH